KPLVPECDRQVGESGEIARECASRLRARAFAAIHVDRQSEYETDGGPFGGERNDTSRVRSKGLACDGFYGGCQLSIRIAGRDPPRFFFQIEAGHRAAGGEKEGRVREMAGGGGGLGGPARPGGCA